MKLIKFTVVLGSFALSSTAAMAAAQPANQYDSSAGMMRNSANAMIDSTKTVFDTAIHPAAISAEIGTLGYGANLAWGLNESVELQAGWTGLKLDADTELNANDSWINYEKALGDDYKDFKGDINFDIDLNNPYIGVQLRPMKNWLTIGAGVLVPSNSFDAAITSTDGGGSEVTVDDVKYTIPEGASIEMNVENKNPLAPYATIGLRPNINDKWGGFLEAGAAYMGKIESTVNVINGTVIGPGGNQGFIQQSEDELNDNGSIWYPILKAGLTYRF